MKFGLVFLLEKLNCLRQDRLCVTLRTGKYTQRLSGGLKSRPNREQGALVAEFPWTPCFLGLQASSLCCLEHLALQGESRHRFLSFLGVSYLLSFHPDSSS